MNAPFRRQTKRPLERIVVADVRGGKVLRFAAVQERAVDDEFRRERWRQRRALGLTAGKANG